MDSSWNDLVVIYERMKRMTACFGREKVKNMKFNGKARRNTLLKTRNLNPGMILSIVYLYLLVVSTNVVF